MAKQLTAPGCKYSIVARVDTTIYSPDQKWTLDIPAGQSDFIAETNEIIIPADAMLCRMKRQIDADLARVNVLGRGAGSLATFVTRAVEQIVGKGNARVEYGDGKLTVSLADSVTAAQMTAVENLLDRLLPKDVTDELEEMPLGYMRAEFLESKGWYPQYIDTDFYSDTMRSFSVRVKKLIVKGSNYMDIIAFVPKDRGVAVGINTGSAHATVSMYGACWGDGLRAGDVGHENPVTLYKDGNMYGRLRADGVDIRTNMYGNYNLAYPFPVSHPVRMFSNIPQEGRNPEQPKIRIYWAKAEADDRSAEFIPVLDSAGVPCMYDLVTRKSFRNQGTGQFTVGMTVDQVINLADLPATGGKLTVSLPWEAQWITRVKNALDKASAKGWIITVQYRDPEVATENIPVGFLESNAYQRVDIPIQPTSDTGFYTDYENLTNRQFQHVLSVSADSAALIFTPHYNGAVYSFFAAYVARNQTERWNIVDVPLLARKVATFNYLNSRTCEIDGIHKFDISEDLASYSKAQASLFMYPTSKDQNEGLVGRLYEARVTEGSKIVCRYKPCISPTGTPCMHDTVSDQNFYNSGTGAFIAGFETAEQALKLATLPDVTAETDEAKKSLTVSLPWEARFDSSGVPAAIQVATDKGWTIITQYREPAATTMNLEADFLESTGEQYINTGIRLQDEYTLSTEFEPVSVLQNACVFGARLANPNRVDCIRYGAQNLYQIFCKQNGVVTTVQFDVVRGERYNIDLDSITQTCTINGQVTENINLASPSAVDLYVFCENFPPSGNLANGDRAIFFDAIRMYRFEVRTGDGKGHVLIPALDPAGVPCMHDTVSGQNFYNANTAEGAIPFIVGFDGAEKAAMSLAKLPVTTGGKLTVSLPPEAEEDELVDEACKIAESRGWTIITQYRTN